MNGPRVPLLSALVLAAALQSAVASAQDASPPAAGCTEKPEVCGRHAFEAGVKAYRGSDFPTAIREFRAALSFKWHPAIALNLGLAESKSGKFLDAIRDLEAVRASSAAEPPLKSQAERAIAEAEAELATVEIDAQGPARVSVDGVSVDASVPIRVDPGTHRLLIELETKARIEREITLSARERLQVTVDRTHEIIVLPERASPPPPPAPVRASPPRERHAGVAPVWFYASAGVTAVLSGVTVWSALDTKSAYDDYLKVRSTASQSELDRRVADGHDLELRTNVLLAVAGAAAVGTAALGLFFVDFGGSTAVGAGPGTIRLSGTF